MRRLHENRSSTSACLPSRRRNDRQIITVESVSSLDYWAGSYWDLCVQFVPSRETFFAALGSPGDQMMRDLQTLFDSFEPLLLDVQKFLAEHNLDFQVKV